MPENPDFIFRKYRLAMMNLPRTFLNSRVHWKRTGKSVPDLFQAHNFLQGYFRFLNVRAVDSAVPGIHHILSDYTSFTPVCRECGL
jgi:hypothetical protein